MQDLNLNYSEDNAAYPLSGDYSLHRADPAEWGVYCSVYYNMAYNGFFKEERFDAPHGSRFWIHQGETRIGGVTMLPNKIYLLFFVPPFRETAQVMKLLRAQLERWSDRTQRIKAFEILPDQAELFARAGFWPDAFRCRWMQRPADRFDVSWDDRFAIESPGIEEDGLGGKRYAKQEEIAACDYASFAGGIDAVRRNQRTLADYAPDDANYTNERLLQGSTLVYDKLTGTLAANCRLCLQDGQAAVYRIGVLPAYRGMGLAGNMLKRALTVLHGAYPLLRLYVMEGNTAESVYLELGFVPGVPEIQTMYIPAENE